MIAAFLEQVRDGDMIAPRRLADRLHLPLTRLSRLARINRNTMTSRPRSPAVQAKLGEIARIIVRATEMSGDEGRAIVWFRHQPIPGFGRTAEELVGDGHGARVLDALERMDAGVYS